MSTSAPVIDSIDRVGEHALDQIFGEARTLTAWQDRPVSLDTLHRTYDLAKMAPTSMNAAPARFVVLRSQEAKERLLPALSPGNVEKSRTAGAVVLVAQDTEFYEKLPTLFPDVDGRSFFVGNPSLAEETAFRNSSLQGAYFILAARALGLDCGPMSGFDAAKVNAEFFPDGKWKINFIVNVGFGDRSALPPRRPRLEFDEAVVVL